MNSLAKTNNYVLECVAEEVERPLISLTCADIGTDSTVVEERLTKWFELAKAWSAILLLDEADVFLERRSSSDLKRNNLVAIFLRTLEYYQGILFLTTNRVGTFDEAFLSRIDVPIYFSALTEQNRLQIWQNLFTKLEKERTDKIRVSADVRYYIKEDRDLQDLKWNGREIRSGLSFPIASKTDRTNLFKQCRVPDRRRPGRDRRPRQRRHHHHRPKRPHRYRRGDVEGFQAILGEFASAEPG
jgi:SpoVK/Ycf46/Vps4 family AAA+-type ATPase